MFDDPDSTARLFFFVLLGSAVAVGVFSRYRDRLGQAVQHALIWGLIFVGVILAIGFKDTLMATLMPDRGQMISEDTVLLQKDRSGHFFATLQVNGQDVRFLVDTGATAMVLSRQDAVRVGVMPESRDFIYRSQTANGEVSTARVVLDEVRLAGFVDRNVPAHVNGGPLGTSLLGMGYLDRYSGFQVFGDQMVLTR